jgi:Calcium-activated BK potassium channel alpha subunit
MMIVFQLSSSLLANAAMHPGVATLVCNLITSRSLDVLPSLEPWAIEYAAGAAKEVYSLRLRPSFEGLTFPLAALTIFLETKGQVQLLGFQIRGHDNKLHTELVPDDSHIYERDARAFVLAPDARSVKRLKSDLPISASKAFATPSHIGRSSPSSRDLFATPYLNLHFKTPHISRRPAPSLSPLAPHADGQGNSLEGLESKRSFTATMSFHKATPAHGSRAYHLAAETVALEIARIKLAQAPAAPPHSVRGVLFHSCFRCAASRAC